MKAWLQLLRPPNLFTVPGDPLSGFFLALTLTPGDMNAVNAVLCALSALFLYAGGLIGNDVADYQEDLHERPQRPLPSGRVSRKAAFTASACLAMLGLVVALGAGFQTFGVACIIQCAVMVYNGWLKHCAIPGALVMGLCRGCSFLLGASAALPQACRTLPVMAAATGIMLYISGVTYIADRETVEECIGLRRLLPFASLLIVLPVIAALLGMAPFPFLVFGALAAGWAGYLGWRLSGVPPKSVLESSIGGLIRGLLIIQAAFCTLGKAPGLATAAVLLVLWPISAAVAKRFYAT
jgi:hypothetical protein